MYGQLGKHRFERILDELHDPTRVLGVYLLPLSLRGRRAYSGSYRDSLQSARNDSTSAYEWLRRSIVDRIGFTLEQVIYLGANLGNAIDVGIDSTGKCPRGSSEVERTLRIFEELNPTIPV